MLGQHVPDSGSGLDPVLYRSHSGPLLPAPCPLNTRDRGHLQPHPLLDCVWGPRHTRPPAHFSDLSKPLSNLVFLRAAKICTCRPKEWSVVAICAGGHGENTENLDRTSGVPRHPNLRALIAQDAAYAGIHFSHYCAANHSKT